MSRQWCGTLRLLSSCDDTNQHLNTPIAHPSKPHRNHLNPTTPPQPPGAYQQSAMTAIAFGTGHTIWTGHSDGAVRAHHKGSWDTGHAAACRTPIRALAIDGKGQAWAGDEIGQIKALRFDPRARGVVVIWQALPEGPPVPGASPCVALIGRGQMMLSAGGRAPGAMTLWDIARFTSTAGLDSVAHGAITVLEALPWPVEEEGGGVFMDWRVLSGQTNGQVLLWEAGGGRLRLAAAMGAPTGSAVRWVGGAAVAFVVVRRTNQCLSAAGCCSFSLRCIRHSAHSPPHLQPTQPQTTSTHTQHTGVSHSSRSWA